MLTVTRGRRAGPDLSQPGRDRGDSPHWMDGEAVDPDDVADFEVSKEGDLCIISIFGDERFEVPEAVVFGG